MLDLHNDRPSPRSVRLALFVIAAQFALMLVTLPFAQRMLPAFPGFLGIYWTLAFVFETLTSYLLLIQFFVSRRPMLAALAGAYAFGGTVVIPHALSFPDALFRGAAFGNAQSSIWAWTAWHAGFPLLVGLALLLRDQRPLRRSVVVPVGVGAILLGYAFSALVGVIAFRVALPTLVVNGDFNRGFATGTWEMVLLADALVVVLAFAVGRSRSVLSLWLSVALVAVFCDAALTLVAGGRFHVGWYLSRLYSILASGFVLGALLAEFNRMYRRFAKLATIDGLTGVDNRRAFDERLEVELRSAARSNEPLSLLMLDVDEFKRYNDAYGHLAGDETLQLIASVARGTLARPADTVARYGGEEFAILLPRTPLPGALAVAERIRTAVVDLRREHVASSVSPHVTISIGIATATAGPAHALIQRADEALYDAKRTGRNTVALADTSIASR